MFERVYNTYVNKRPIFLGVSDEVSTCDCCGKQGLKRTVALMVDDMTVNFYGCSCANKALTSNWTQTNYDRFAQNKGAAFRDLVRNAAKSKMVAA